MRASFLGVVLLSVIIVGACAPSRGTSTAISSVDYRRTGGIIGLDDHLSIDANGQAQLTRRTSRSTFTLPPAQFQQLSAVFAGANFTSLGAEYLPTPGGADLIGYVITYNGQTVRTADSAVPEAVRPVLNLLNQIIETNGK